MVFAHPTPSACLRFIANSIQKLCHDLKDEEIIEISDHKDNALDDDMSGPWDHCEDPDRDGPACDRPISWFCTICIKPPLLSYGSTHQSSYRGTNAPKKTPRPLILRSGLAMILIMPPQCSKCNSSFFFSHRSTISTVPSILFVTSLMIQNTTIPMQTVVQTTSRIKPILPQQSHMLTYTVLLPMFPEAPLPSWSHPLLILPLTVVTFRDSC